MSSKKQLCAHLCDEYIFESRSGTIALIILIAILFVISFICITNYEFNFSKFASEGLFILTAGTLFSPSKKIVIMVLTLCIFIIIRAIKAEELEKDASRVPAILLPEDSNCIFENIDNSK